MSRVPSNSQFCGTLAPLSLHKKSPFPKEPLPFASPRIAIPKRAGLGISKSPNKSPKKHKAPKNRPTNHNSPKNLKNNTNHIKPPKTHPTNHNSPKNCPNLPPVWATAQMETPACPSASSIDQAAAARPLLRGPGPGEGQEGHSAWDAQPGGRSGWLMFFLFYFLFSFLVSLHRV